MQHVSMCYIKLCILVGPSVADIEADDLDATGGCVLGPFRCRAVAPQRRGVQSITGSEGFWPFM